uniref:Uncharacterized protein n=1 Tax=Nelumbo nucifera TaxID=4432 RepID=A0A822XF77_NELNU|nr:TPA_asm: hypothetical protein HUJ06_019776 [Nelumbo nucifera]
MCDVSNHKTRNTMSVNKRKMLIQKGGKENC